jgi:hypothetical protein
MAYSGGLHTFNEVLNKIMLQSKKRSGRATLAELLVDAVREMNLYTGNEGIKWKKITPGSINDVDFPSDLEEFVAVGVPLDGRLWLLSPEKSMIRTTTEVSGSETQDSTDGEGVSLRNETISNYYTTGGFNPEGYYTVDFTNRRLLLNSVNKSEVILVYKVSGITTDATPYIPSKYIAFLTAHVLWNEVRYLPDMQGLAQRFEDQHRKELNKLQDSELPSLHEFYDAILETTTMRPQR